MATVANMLDLMEMLDNSLETGAAEADEFRSIVALNAAQDAFETLLASETHLVNARTSVATVLNTETTSFPTGMLRVQQIQMLDVTQTPNRIQYTLERIFDTGGQGPSRLPWPLLAASPTATGKPNGYTVDFKSVNWRPIPDGVYTLRFSGFTQAANFTVRGDTLSYDDHVMLPFAVLASRILKIGTDDVTAEVTELARDVFGPSLSTMKKTSRVRGAPRVYSTIHET